MTYMNRRGRAAKEKDTLRLLARISAEKLGTSDRASWEYLHAVLHGSVRYTLPSERTLPKDTLKVLYRAFYDFFREAYRVWSDKLFKGLCVDEGEEKARQTLARIQPIDFFNAAEAYQVQRAFERVTSRAELILDWLAAENVPVTFDTFAEAGGFNALGRKLGMGSMGLNADDASVFTIEGEEPWDPAGEDTRGLVLTSKVKVPLRERRKVPELQHYNLLGLFAAGVAWHTIEAAAPWVKHGQKAGRIGAPGRLVATAPTGEHLVRLTDPKAVMVEGALMGLCLRWQKTATLYLRTGSILSLREPSGRILLTIALWLEGEDFHHRESKVFGNNEPAPGTREHKLLESFLDEFNLRGEAVTWNRADLPLELRVELQAVADRHNAALGAPKNTWTVVAADPNLARQGAQAVQAKNVLPRNMPYDLRIAMLRATDSYWLFVGAFSLEENLKSFKNFNHEGWIIGSSEHLKSSWRKDYSPSEASSPTLMAVNASVFTLWPKRLRALARRTHRLGELLFAAHGVSLSEATSTWPKMAFQPSRSGLTWSGKISNLRWTALSPISLNQYNVLSFWERGEPAGTLSFPVRALTVRTKAGSILKLTQISGDEGSFSVKIEGTWDLGPRSGVTAAKVLSAQRQIEALKKKIGRELAAHLEAAPQIQEAIEQVEAAIEDVRPQVETRRNALSKLLRRGRRAGLTPDERQRLDLRRTMEALLRAF